MNEKDLIKQRDLYDELRLCLDELRKLLRFRLAEIYYKEWIELNDKFRDYRLEVVEEKINQYKWFINKVK